MSRFVPIIFFLWKTQADSPWPYDENDSELLGHCRNFTRISSEGFSVISNLNELNHSFNAIHSILVGQCTMSTPLGYWVEQRLGPVTTVGKQQAYFQQDSPVGQFILGNDHFIVNKYFLGVVDRTGVPISHPPIFPRQQCVPRDGHTGANTGDLGRAAARR